MKQCITQEQFDEINDEQKFYFQWGHWREINVVFLLKRELPTIGQMIEFLEKHPENDYHDSDEYHSYTNQVMFSSVGMFWHEPELCDSLWIEVKARLSDEELHDALSNVERSTW